MGSCGGTKGATATETSARAVDTGQCCKAGRADTATRGPASESVRGNGAQARREQGPRTPAAQQGKGHRGTKAEEVTKGHAATAASVAHAQKTPPPFAEDEVDLALSRNIAQLLYQAECEKIEVAQRAINVKTRWWNTMAHGRDLHHCPACAFAHKQEDAVLRHCREQHAAEGKLYPYTLACAHGVQQCGPSCALASVLAVVSHFPEEATFSRELRDTYAAPSKSRNGTHRGSMRPAAASGAGDCTGGGGRQRACAPGALSGQARGDPEVRRVWSGRGAARRGRQLPDSVRRHGGAAAATARASPPGR
ncbi:hypothetical protein ERJ75_000915400 [Trypanosoma vivax]|nr:hypothetical protein ERJ75_000915400 [Trypanosoma vivax]